MNSGMDAYRIFKAIKRHFTTPAYEYFKYQGREIKIADYNNCNDRYRFQKLAQKHTTQTELEDFLVANWLARPYNWVNDVLNPEAEATFLEWQKHIQSFTYFFSEDATKLAAHRLLFRPPHPGENPPILQMLLWHEISLETFILMNKLYEFFPLFDRGWNKDGKHIQLGTEWNMVRARCAKYEPFLLRRLNIGDSAKFRKILRSKIEANGVTA